MRFSNRFLTIVLLALAALTSQTKTTQAVSYTHLTLPTILLV